MNKHNKRIIDKVYSDEIMEKVVAEKKVLLTPYEELSAKDKEMAQLMVYMIWLTWMF